MRLDERHQTLWPLEQMELALVRSLLERPHLVNAHEEAVLRSALSLARMYKVRHEGRDVGVGAFLTPFRDEVARRLGPVLLARQVHRTQLLPHLRDLKSLFSTTYAALLTRFANRLPAEALDRELRHKALVLVGGGGGGTGYVYVGAMGLLDEHGLTPKLMAGTSIGAILSLFRSRMPRFELEEFIHILRALTWKKLFRAVSTENRYGLPAALRLFLRSGLGRYFGADHPDRPTGMALKDLPIPTIVSVNGIRRGKLPRPLEFYEGALNLSPRALLNPVRVLSMVQSSFSALYDFFNHPEVLVRLHLGLDDESQDFDALDAAGFSSALPGVIHYDVLRDDPRMHGMLEALMEKHRLFRLIDGGMADNLPCQAAWRAVHKGRIGTRNVFILGLNGFAMKATTPMWLPLQRLAEINVAPNRRYAHLIQDFRRTLAPTDLVPSVELLSRAVTLGRAQLTEKMPLITRMMAPLPKIA